jgi:hypothetical protein
MTLGRLVCAGVMAALVAGAGVSGAQAAKKKHIARHRTATARVIAAAPRRAPVRIQIYGDRTPLHRDCRAVFDERWIPEWGGRVLYAGQDCWWAHD